MQDAARDEFSWPHMLVGDVAEAVEAWNDHAMLVGAPASGLIVTHFSQVHDSSMMDIIRPLVPEGTVQSHPRKAPHVFLRYPSGAELRISPVWQLREAMAFAGSSFTWMAFDNPRNMKSDLIKYMLMTLNSQGVESRLVAIGSPFDFISAPMTTAPQQDAGDMDVLVMPDPIVHVDFPPDPAD